MFKGFHCPSLITTSLSKVEGALAELAQKHTELELRDKELQDQRRTMKATSRTVEDAAQIAPSPIQNASSKQMACSKTCSTVFGEPGSANETHNGHD